MHKASMLEAVRLTVTEAVIQAYAELTDDFNPIHVDPVFAAGTAMGRPIAHGTLSLCLIWQCLRRSFGAGVLADLQLDVRFVKPVHIGDELVAAGELDATGQCKVWVRGADGSDRVVGTVVCDTSSYIQRGYEA